MIKNAENPGPGNYTHSHAIGGPAYSMGAKLLDKNDNWQPGPGKYDGTKDSVYGDPKASLFGRGDRSDIAKGKKGPGPGAYNTTGFRAQESHSYSIGTGQRQKGKDAGNPGPGQYHVPYYVADVPRY